MPYKLTLNACFLQRVLLADTNVPTSKEEVGPVKQHGSKSHLIILQAGDTYDEDDGSQDQCAICLNDYDDGDEICWSQNKQCNHVFHKGCISEWLLTHEECPCCRYPYLSFNDIEEGSTEKCATESSTIRPVHVPAVTGDEYVSDDDNSALTRGLQLFHDVTWRTTPSTAPQTEDQYSTHSTNFEFEGNGTGDDGNAQFDEEDVSGGQAGLYAPPIDEVSQEDGIHIVPTTPISGS
jgi:Ring finger domain